jgi:hypothetical protein
LLLFIVGATATANRPDTAPTGIVNVIELSLQEFTVTGASFSVTMLLPCVAPNPEPEIVAWLPIAPPSGRTLEIAGAGLEGVLIETLSKVAVAKVEVEVLLTASPIYTF